MEKMIMMTMKYNESSKLENRNESGINTLFRNQNLLQKRIEKIEKKLKMYNESEHIIV